MSRYSCQLCSMYFKTTDALSEHGKKFNARCFHMNHGVRFDPVYTVSTHSLTFHHKNWTVYLQTQAFNYLSYFDLYRLDWNLQAYNLYYFQCHLCDFSKASSLFGHHCQGIQHQHKVSAEAATHKDKYGVSSKDHFYSCENCLMASSLENTINHLKVRTFIIPRALWLMVSIRMILASVFIWCAGLVGWM